MHRVAASAAGAPMCNMEHVNLYIMLQHRLAKRHPNSKTNNSGGGRTTSY